MTRRTATETKPALDYRRVAWDDLRPHPANPKNGDTDAIAESVRTSGVYRPIIVANDGTILAGHHLWHALGELGHTEVDIVRLTVAPDSMEARRILIADNRTADLGVYDPGVLLDNLRTLDESVGLIGTGFTHDDMLALLNTNSLPFPPPPPPDEPQPTNLECPNCGYDLTGKDT